MKSKLFSVNRGPKEFLTMHRDIYLKDFSFDAVDKEQQLQYMNNQIILELSDLQCYIRRNFTGCLLHDANRLLRRFD